MANLQIKNLPDEMHDALRARARQCHVTMSKLVTELLDRELGRLRIDEWIEKRNASSLPKVDVDVVGLLDEVREDYDPR